MASARLAKLVHMEVLLLKVLENTLLLVGLT